MDDEPTMASCFPYDDGGDATCAECGSWVMTDQRNRHVDWHSRLWTALQPAA